ncbi:MAG: hypothetical protein U0Q12_19255 [Vicinamibacterales bacterium]
MVPAGYMAKHVIERPDGLRADNVSAIHSVSSCMSPNFADHINYWKHNGYWLFDSPEVIVRIGRENGIDLAGTTLFYYEVHELQFDGAEWTRFEPEASFGTNVRVPDSKEIEGYDVVSFFARSAPECSPLSCNGLAADIETNSRCLLTSFEQARGLLQDGAFRDAEPGPYRIFAVYSVEWPEDPGAIRDALSSRRSSRGARSHRRRVIGWRRSVRGLGQVGIRHPGIALKTTEDTSVDAIRSGSWALKPMGAPAA